MTKEITKAEILQQIQDKFKLREFEVAPFLFDETVIPVYNIEQHLTRFEVRHTTVSITSADAFLFFVVPLDEQWTLRAYQVIYGMTGAIKGTGVYATWRPGLYDYIYFDMTKGQEISYLVTLPAPVILAPQTRLFYLIDTYVSTQDLTIDVDISVETIR